MVLLYHPDKNTGVSDELFKKIQKGLQRFFFVCRFHS